MGVLCSKAPRQPARTRANTSGVSPAVTRPTPSRRTPAAAKKKPARTSGVSPAVTHPTRGGHASGGSAPNPIHGSSANPTHAGAGTSGASGAVTHPTQSGHASGGSAPDTVSGSSVNPTRTEDLQRRLNTVLDTPKNKRLIEEHIKGLAKQTLSCRPAFENVSRLLSSFDKGNFKTKDNNTPLQPGWDELSKKYDDLLRRSRSNAVILKAVCDDYIVRVLGALRAPHMSISDITKEVKSFIESTEKSEKNVQSSAEDFDKLRGQVVSYIKVIETLSGASALSSISELRHSISELKLEIVSTQALVVKDLKEALNGPAMISVLWTLCPELGNSIAFELELSKSPSLERLTSQLSQLREKEESVGRLRRQGKLEEFIADFDASRNALNRLVMHAAALSNFWESVRADCQSAIIHLTRDAGKKTADFGIRKALGVDLAGSVYLMLSETLGTYVGELSSLES